MSSAQKVPAWKRLGLKLKQPASGAEIGGPASAEGSKPNGQQSHDRHASGPVANAANASPAAAAAAAKRKRLDQQAPPASSSPFKRTRTDVSTGYPTPTLRKQKSVTFADDVKNPTAAEPTRKSKGPKKAAKTAKQQPTADIKPSLEYLRTWKSSRETWKFKKNHQTILMKRVFHADAIPSSDIATFYEYIQDLKGFPRTRLRETAAEVKKEDTENGKAAFPEGTPDMDSKQSEYEKVLAGLMQLGAGSGSKRKRFDETGFVSQSTDVAITQRVIKRMRAETILEELSDSDDSDAMTVDTEEAAPATQEAAAAQDETVDKRVKLNDGTKQPTARRRKRRTNVDSSSESSDSESSESDSGSDSDSDSDSDDSDNASEIQRQAAQREAETSSESSSSSSSSEDEDSSSEDDSEEEEGTTKKKGSKK